MATKKISQSKNSASAPQPPESSGALLPIFTEEQCLELREIDFAISSAVHVFDVLNDGEIYGHDVYALLRPIEHQLAKLMDDIEGRIEKAKQGGVA